MHAASSPRLAIHSGSPRVFAVRRDNVIASFGRDQSVQSRPSKLTISLDCADYQEQKKWHEIESKFDPLIADLRDVQGLTYSLLKRLETHGLFVENVRGRNDGNRPVIYAITPTFARPVQKAELTRLAQTFLHVVNFHWIVVEDAPQKTVLVTRLLETSGLIYTHLSAATPPNYKLGRNDPNWKKPRGVEQRNAALRWLRENLKPSDKGVVYFADDDNTYSVKLFHEVRDGSLRRILISLNKITLESFLPLFFSFNVNDLIQSCLLAILYSQYFNSYNKKNNSFDISNSKIIIKQFRKKWFTTVHMSVSCFS